MNGWHETLREVISIYDREVSRLRRRRTARKESRGGTYLRVRTADVYGGVIPERTNAQERGELAALAASIARHGLLQPIVVRENAQEGRYALVCGGRRLAACRMLGMDEVDALLIEGDQAEGTACFLEEHLTRRPPSPVDEARAAEHAGGARLRERLALPWALVEDRLKLLRLGGRVCALIQREGLRLEQAQPLLTIQDEARCLEAAAIVASRDLTAGQARRLILGEMPGVKAASRRRAVRMALEEAQQLAARLERQGMICRVTLQKQERGICVQILMKSDEMSPHGQEKESAGENNAHVPRPRAGMRRAQTKPDL